MPDVIAVYTDSDNTANGTCSINVPDVETDDWIVALTSAVYEAAATSMQVAGTGAGVWEAIGVQLGDSGPFANSNLHAFRKVATGSGAYTVVGATLDHPSLIVYHLRNCGELEASIFGAQVVQNNSNNAVNAGPITTTEDGTLVIGAFSLVQFGGAKSWSGPAGMTGTSADTPDGVGQLRAAAGTQATAGSSGTKTATSTASSANGEASKLFAITHQVAGPTFPITEDFEDTEYAVEFTGDWTRSTTAAHTGSYSLQAADIGNGEESSITVTVPAGSETMQFWWKTSTEANWDYFALDVGTDVEIFARSGERDWTQSVIYDVSAAGTVKFRFYKDSADPGAFPWQDTAWIDDIVFAQGGEAAPEYTDRLNQTFAGSTLTSTYHIYAEGIDPDRDVGVLFYFHGDGGYDFDQENDFPNDFYALPGPLGVVEQARSRNLITVAPRTPTADDTWWTDGGDNTVWVNELFNELSDNYGIDHALVWLTGYSGGAQFITQFLLMQYPRMATGGGAVMFGGGGEPVLLPTDTFTPELKSNFPMVWYTGEEDKAANSPGEGYDGLLEAQAGADWYETEGFTVYRDFPENVDHTDLEYKFGPVVGYYMERIGWGTLSTVIEYTFDSTTQLTSGNWVRVTGTPTPYAGAGALQSAQPGQPGTSDGVLAVPADALGMRFRYRVNTEEYGDLFWVGVDSDLQPCGSGRSPYGWSESPPYDVSGATSVTFRFVRDSSGGQAAVNGDPGNRVTIDSVLFEYASTGPEPGRMLLAG